MTVVTESKQKTDALCVYTNKVILTLRLSVGVEGESKSQRLLKCITDKRLINEAINYT
jgi:hypothetical protein